MEAQPYRNSSSHVPGPTSLGGLEPYRGSYGSQVRSSLSSERVPAPSPGSPPCLALELQMNLFPGARGIQPIGSVSASPRTSSTTTWSSRSAIWEAMPSSSASTSSALCRFGCYRGEGRGVANGARGWAAKLPPPRSPPPSPAVHSQIGGSFLSHRLIPHSG